MHKNPTIEICDGCGRKLLTNICTTCKLDLCVVCNPDHFCIEGRKDFVKLDKKQPEKFKPELFLTN